MSSSMRVETTVTERTRRVTRKVGAGWGAVATVALLTAMLPASPSTAASSTNTRANQAYAVAQLVTRSNFPSGFKADGKVYITTSDDSTSASMLNTTQLPELTTCLGKSAPLSVTAGQAESPVFWNEKTETIVLDLADVYPNQGDAKADFPPFKDPKFANCFVQVQGANILSIEKDEWPPSTTFGTLTGSVVRAPRYGDQSGMVAAKVPVQFTDGTSTSDYFDVLVIRQGRSTAQLYFDQSGRQPSSSLVKGLAQTVTKKMKAKPPKNTILPA